MKNLKNVSHSGSMPTTPSCSILIELVHSDGADAEVLKDDFSMFTQTRHRVAGFDLTLEELNHLVLRGHATYPDISNTPAAISTALIDQHALIFPNGQFDARLNFAISFGARGFPPMPLRAYRADTLDAVLEDRTRAFINNAAYGVNSNGISVLFHWFRRDFTLSAGPLNASSTGILKPTSATGLNDPSALNGGSDDTPSMGTQCGLDIFGMREWHPL